MVLLLLQSNKVTDYFTEWNALYFVQRSSIHTIQPFSAMPFGSAFLYIHGACDFEATIRLLFARIRRESSSCDLLSLLSSPSPPTVHRLDDGRVAQVYSPFDSFQHKKKLQKCTIFKGDVLLSPLLFLQKQFTHLPAPHFHPPLSSPAIHAPGKQEEAYLA